MKKARRAFVRVVSGLAVAVVALAVVCLDGVDYHPYFKSDYYAETAQRLEKQASAMRLATGQLAAGFGRALLTPVLNAPQDEPAQGRFRSLPLAGYGNRKGRAATGTHDDLYVKAVALQVGLARGVIVSADALIVPSEVADKATAELERSFQLRREQIYFGATHTHASLGGWGEGFVSEAFAGDFQPGVRTWWADRIVSAVGEAMADLKPAALGHGTFTVPGRVRNRLVGQVGEVDSSFNYIVLRQDGGATGIVGSYGAHATVLPGRFMQFSGDYPGFWQRAVEAVAGGTAVFLAGAVGSHSPVPSANGLEGAEEMGRTLAHALLRQIESTPMTRTVTFGTLGCDMVLPAPQVRVSGGLRLRPWLARRAVPLTEEACLQGFRLNKAIWISTPCDFSGELAIGIRDSLGVRGFDAAITSFNGGYIGYVVPGRYYHLNSYESRLMSFYGPQMPDFLDEFLRRIAAELTGSAPVELSPENAARATEVVPSSGAAETSGAPGRHER